MIAVQRNRLLVLAVVMTALLVALGACGRKGSPKPPEGRESAYTYPQAYPEPASTGPVPEGEDPQRGRGLLSIFDGPEKETAEPEPESILVLPPRETLPFEQKGPPSVVPKSRTRTTTY